MNTLIQNLRYGMRGLWKNPGFTLIAVLSLALGIGANTAIFSLINAVLLKPLPFAEPDRLAILWEDATFAGFPRNTPSPANYADWKAQSHTMEDMAAIDWRSFNLTGDGEPERVEARGATANLFPMLGIRPALGRYFSAEEDKPDGHKVVMLSYRLWQSRYGGERSIIGRDLLLNSEKYTVIGVLPAGFQFLEKEVGMWVPMAFTQELLNNRGRHYLTVVGRMKPGVTLPEAQTDIQTVMQRIVRDHPEETFDGKVKSLVLPLREELAGEVRRPLIVLLVAVGFVLLIACANIANLLLARAANRRKEIAIRTALGASRARIVGQLLTESLLLAVAGAIVGLLLASWSFNFLRRMVPEGMASSTDLSLDWRILGFTLMVALLTGLIFGIAPALQTARVDLNEALKQSGGRTDFHASGSSLRNALVVAEVALALVLLVGAGLLIQTFFKLRGQYGGLQAENVLTLRTQLPDSKYNELPRRVQFYDQVLARVKTLPGVVSAAYATSVPLVWKGGTSGFLPEGAQPSPGLSYDANFREVSADYFKTIGIAVQQGRGFAESDNAQSVPVTVINETMAREYWPGVNAVGKRFDLGDPREHLWVTVVGIAADVRQMAVDAPVKAEMYFPYQQVSDFAFYKPRDLVIRTSVEPTSLTAAVRREIHAVDPDQPVSNIRTMAEILGEETASRKLGMTLLATFAGLALLLSVLGIYGVLSYFVAQHTPEIGVRMALGAQPGNILGLILKKGMLLAVVGVGIGLIASFALTRLMQSLLYDVSASDPLTFAGVAGLLSVIAFLACYLPARRATKVDPLIALRYE